VLRSVYIAMSTMMICSRFKERSGCNHPFTVYTAVTLFDAIFATIYPFVISASLDCRGLPKIVGMLSGKQNVALSTLQDACVSSETIGR